MTATLLPVNRTTQNRKRKIEGISKNSNITQNISLQVTSFQYPTFTYTAPHKRN
jgi:hypothetical protein